MAQGVPDVEHVPLPVLPPEGQGLPGPEAGGEHQGEEGVEAVPPGGFKKPGHLLGLPGLGRPDRPAPWGIHGVHGVLVQEVGPHGVPEGGPQKLVDVAAVGGGEASEFGEEGPEGEGAKA